MAKLTSVPPTLVLIRGFNVSLMDAQTAVPVVINHVLKDFSADEEIFSARFLISSGCSCSVWRRKKKKQPFNLIITESDTKTQRAQKEENA